MTTAVCDCAGILFGLWALGLVADLVPGAGGEVLIRLAFAGYFSDFVRGIIDTQGIVYYLSLTALFLFMAVRSIETGRWR